MAIKIGLDGRAEDKNGKIRLKNGATKIKTLIKENSEYKAFTPSATLTNIRKRYGVRSEEEVLKLAKIKIRAKKYGA